MCRDLYPHVCDTAHVNCEGGYHADNACIGYCATYYLVTEGCTRCKLPQLSNTQPTLLPTLSCCLTCYQPCSCRSSSARSKYTCNNSTHALQREQVCRRYGCSWGGGSILTACPDSATTASALQAKLTTATVAHLLAAADVQMAAAHVAAQSMLCSCCQHHTLPCSRACQGSVPKQRTLTVASAAQPAVLNLARHVLYIPHLEACHDLSLHCRRALKPMAAIQHF